MKKLTFALIFSILAITSASAQTLKKDSTNINPPVLFGGTAAYNTWSVGVTLGATTPHVLTSTIGDFSNAKVGLAGGISLKKQIAPAFGLQLEGQFGRVNFANSPASDNLQSDATTFYMASASGVVRVAALNFLRRENAIQFYLKGGLGWAAYRPSVTLANGLTQDFKNPGISGVSHTISSLAVPIGAGVQFKLNSRTAINIGYTETFIDADNFDGLNKNYPGNDHFAQAYAGLEFTLGKRSKPNLSQINPVTLLTSALSDPELRREIEALKARVDKIAGAPEELKKDSDGDGVSDTFDKCPNTPAGTVVDGSGCEIRFPQAATADSVQAAPLAYTNIQFDQNNANLKTSTYPLLDATSAEMRSDESIFISVTGFNSAEELKKNTLISFQRAEQVKLYLINSGVNPDHILTIGKGSLNPIASNSNEEGRIANRRAVFGHVVVQGYHSVKFSATGTKILYMDSLKLMANELKKHLDWKVIIYGHFSLDDLSREEKKATGVARIARERAKIVKDALKTMGIRPDRFVEIEGSANKTALKDPEQHVAEIFAITFK